MGQGEKKQPAKSQQHDNEKPEVKLMKCLQQSRISATISDSISTLVITCRRFLNSLTNDAPKKKKR